jgi:capsular polysaccharide biosynthesis protein
VLQQPGKTFGSALRNHYRAVATITLLFLVVAAVASFVRPPTYSATALLVVDERQTSGQGSDTSLQQSQIVGQQYMSLATSRSLATKVCQTVGRQVPCDPDSLSRDTSASMEKGTTIIELTVAAASPDEAALLANAVAAELVAEVQAQAQALVKPNLDLLNQQLGQLNDQIQQQKAALAKLPAGDTRDATAINAQISQLESEQATTFQRIQDQQLQEKNLGNDLSISQQARPPARPSDPDPVKYLLIALSSGLLMGVIVALLRERFDHSLRRGQSLAQAAGVDLVIDEGDGPSGRDADDASFDLARASLLSRYPGAQKIMMVAASRNDDAGGAASGLARAAASFGQQVLVVEAEASGNGRSPKQRRRFKSGRGTVTLASVGTNELAAVIDGDGAEYDLMVVALSSPMTNPTAVLLAPRTDLIVLVATSGRTSFDDAREAAELLRRSGADVGAGILVANARATDMVSSNENGHVPA